MFNIEILTSKNKFFEEELELLEVTARLIYTED